MNKKTYEALKRIINQRGYHYFSVESGKRDYKQVENWIDEVAKEYEEEKVCPACETGLNRFGQCPLCKQEE